LVQLCQTENNLAVLNKYHKLQEKSLQKLDNFIQDVLGYARNARLNLEIVPINIHTCLQSIVDVTSSLSERKDIAVEYEISQNVPFYCDKYRIELIFNNLISNAFRYHNPEKPKQFIRIKANISPTEAVIVLSDNGLGIEDKHINRIFEMFYRANTTSKGSGLGLYIVKEAIEKLSGNIHVESEVGKGTSFYLTLPNFKEASHKS
jgi:signal transduction histidine kinase